MTSLKCKFAFAAILIAAGCGTPRKVVMQNVQSGPVDSQGTAIMATLAQTANPTESASMKATNGSGHDGMIMPTQSSPANSGPIPTESGFVLLWELFGTPTGTPPGQSSGDPAAAPINTQVPSPAVQAASPTLLPTATMHTPAGPPTLPPTATKPVASGSAGDPTRGKTRFSGSAGCAGCHDATQGVILSGPSLKGVGTRAITRKQGMSAIDYLRESIRQPNAYVVKGFTPGVMLQNYGQTLTNGQIDDLVAYLIMLK